MNAPWIIAAGELLSQLHWSQPGLDQLGGQLGVNWFFLLQWIFALAAIASAAAAIWICHKILEELK